MKEKDYINWAIHYKNQAKLKRCNAAVHLEADADEKFWSKIFQHFLPEYSFDYIYFTRTPEGNKATGCQTCLKYFSFGCLSKEFFICIDSDYRYLLHEKDIDIEHFIFQTYTDTYTNEEKCAYFSNKGKTISECLTEDIHFGRYSEINKIKSDTEKFKTL